MKDEVDFLPADKCWKFFQTGTIILRMWMKVARHMQSTQQTKFVKF